MELATALYRPSIGWAGPLQATSDSARTLVLAFGAADVADDARPLAELARAFPRSQVLGCSTSGNILGEHVTDDGLVVAVARFEHTDLARAIATIANAGESLAAGRSIAEQLVRPGLRAVFVCSDGLGVNGSDLVRGIVANVGPGVRVTGGLAGDGDRFRRTWVVDGGAARARHRDGRRTVRRCPARRPRLGWGVGPLRSRTSHHQIGRQRPLRDRRAARAGPVQAIPGERAAGLPATALLFPLALRASSSDTHRLVRTVLAVDEATQSMTFAGDVPTGHLGQLMRGNVEHLIDGATAAAESAVAGFEGCTALTVAVSCVGRRLVLGERTEEELEAVAESGGAAAGQVGFYSYGEICPHSTGGGTAAVADCTTRR